MIEARHLTKKYERLTAVDDVSFTAEPGRVTGFVGPNGAGKSTTLRLLLGLDRPTSGTATVAGRRYVDLGRPLTVVGALLDAADAHPARTATAHLTWLAQSNRIPRRRIGEVLERVGLAGVGRRRIGAFSLGMRQRLGIAAALLGDPEVLILDEPVNGLDPEAIVWFRGLVRSLADDGRTVLLSSHLMAEMARVADDVVVIAAGRVVEAGPLGRVVGSHVDLEAAYFALTGTTPGPAMGWADAGPAAGRSDAGPEASASGAMPPGSAYPGTPPAGAAGNEPTDPGTVA